MLETCFDTFQLHFVQQILQLHYLDCDSFVLSIRTQKLIDELQNLEDLFDFSNLNKSHELYSNENKKAVGNFETETPSNFVKKKAIFLSM